MITSPLDTADGRSGTSSQHPNTPVIANFQVMFPAGSGTRARLIALASRNGSRAEQLFGVGVQITHADVSATRQV